MPTQVTYKKFEMNEEDITEDTLALKEAGLFLPLSSSAPRLKFKSPTEDVAVEDRDAAPLDAPTFPSAVDAPPKKALPPDLPQDSGTRNRSAQEKAQEIDHLVADAAAVLNSLGELPPLPFTGIAAPLPPAKPKPQAKPKPKRKSTARAPGTAVSDVSDTESESDTESDSDDPDSATAFAVESIIAARGNGGRRQYHIKWAGADETSWEKAANILDKSLIKHFEASQPKVCASRTPHASRLTPHVYACVCMSLASTQGGGGQIKSNVSYHRPADACTSVHPQPPQGRCRRARADILAPSCFNEL